VPPATVSWGSSAWVRHMVCPQQGASIIDHHDCVFSGKGCHVTIVRDLIDFHASGEGSRCHEILHRVIVPELLEVVRGWWSRPHHG
jgi:hypothetical protein